VASATQRTQGLFWDGVQGAHWVRTIPVALALGCYPSLDALAACGDANLTVRRVEQGIQVHLTGIHVGGRAAAPERSLAPCGGVGEANDVFNVSTPPCLCQWRLMMERLASFCDMLQAASWSASALVGLVPVRPQCSRATRVCTVAAAPPSASFSGARAAQLSRAAQHKLTVTGSRRAPARDR